MSIETRMKSSGEPSKPSSKTSTNQVVGTTISRGGCFSNIPKRTLVLRVVFVASLAVAAALSAGVAYVVIARLERTLGEKTYESVAVSATEGAKTIAHRKLEGGTVMAMIMSFAFPDAASWPFVSLNGYTEINKRLAGMSASGEHGLTHLVDPEKVDVEEYERFMHEMYEDNDFANFTGVNDFGFGIWKKDPNSPYEDGRVHDSTGLTSYGSPNKILTPLVKIAHKKSKNMMFNLHSEAFRGAAIDSMIQCSEEGAGSSAETPCQVVTDMLVLLQIKGPAAIIFTPIYPANDPNTLVGMIATAIFWEDILRNIVP